jgi:hypothetical protein
VLNGNSISDGRPSPLATRSKIDRKLEQIQLGVSVIGNRTETVILIDNYSEKSSNIYQI